MDTVTKRFKDKGYVVEITYPSEAMLFTLQSSHTDDDNRIRSFHFAQLDEQGVKRLKKAYDCDLNNMDTDVYLIAEHADRCYFRPFYLLLQNCREGRRLSVLWSKTFFFAVSHLLKTT